MRARTRHADAADDYFAFVSLLIFDAIPLMPMLFLPLCFSWRRFHATLRLLPLSTHYFSWFIAQAAPMARCTRRDAVSIRRGARSLSARLRRAMR